MSRHIPASVKVTIPKKNFADQTTKPFTTKVKGEIFQGFVVKKDGKFFAYQNLCRHLPITLDLNDGKFFTHDKQFLQCHMHGAMYEIASGLCIAGPCLGARLRILEIEEDATKITVRIPSNFLEETA